MRACIVVPLPTNGRSWYTTQVAHWICERCGKGFQRARAGPRPIRFCSQICYWGHRRIHPDEFKEAGQFQPGSKPWNKNLKGLHQSPDTEFKPGQVSINLLPLGSVRVRVRNRDKGKRAWIKIAEDGTSYDWRPRALVEWEKHFGPLPEGAILHHMERDTLNDDITNLAALSRAAHLIEHRPEFEKRRRNRASRATKRRWQDYRLKDVDSYYWEGLED